MTPVALVRPYALPLAGLAALVLVSAAAEAVGLVLLSAVLSALTASPAAVPPFLAPLHSEARAAPERAIALLGAVYVGKGVLALLTNYASFTLGLRMADDWRVRLLRGYLRTPLRNLRRQHGSMLQLLIDEPSTVGSGVASGGILVQNVLSIGSVYAALLVLSPVLTIGLTTMAGVATAAVLVLSRFARSVALRRSLAVNETYGYVAELLSALKQIRLFGIEDRAQQSATEHLARTRGLTRTSNVLVSSPRLMIEIIFLVGLAALLWVARPTAVSTAPLSDLGLVVAAAFRLLPSLSASAGTGVQLAQAWPGMRRIAAEISDLERSEPHVAATHPAPAGDTLEVDGLHFAYPEREAALRGVDMAIARGEFIGVVGPSGSGKSTLADLLCAFHPPTQGRILVDGVDLRTIDAGSWRRKLGVVAQDTFLFSGTILDNLTLLAQTATDREIEDVLQVVGANDFIVDLPDGLKTRLGERGLRLSGGQRQRLAIARVLLRRPEILIMDEATSALDVRADESLQERLERVRGDMTLIVIAHRLSAVRQADRIYVLVGGRVVEAGTHEVLLARGGSYAAMWSAATSPRIATEVSGQ